jgi:D-glycero-alpha-D-manno-heptose-7-phosphate kinase
VLITRAPLRISFFGGGTDYPEHFREHGGAVLGTAIDRYSYVTATPFPSQLFDYHLRVSYRRVELVENLEQIEHGVYRECLRLCGLERDVELHNVADLPAFTGLGSSAAFAVGLLHALHAFKGETRTPLELAREATHIEREALREPAGCQDQVFAALGGMALVEFGRDGEITVRRPDLSVHRREELERHLLLVFTHKSRRSAEVIEPQLARLTHNRETLLGMRRMVDRGWDLFTAGAFSAAALGELLHQAWLAKRSLAQEISSPEIDDLYRRAREAGALGGKLLGAGGGGFLLLVVPPELQPAVAAALPRTATLQVRVDAPGSQVIFSG